MSDLIANNRSDNSNPLAMDYQTAQNPPSIGSLPSNGNINSTDYAILTPDGRIIYALLMKIQEENRTFQEGVTRSLSKINSRLELFPSIVQSLQAPVTDFRPTVNTEHPSSSTNETQIPSSHRHENQIPMARDPIVSLPAESSLPSTQLNTNQTDLQPSGYGNRLAANRGSLQISQYCFEGSSGAAEGTSALIPATNADHISTSSVILPVKRNAVFVNHRPKDLPKMTVPYPLVDARRDSPQEHSRNGNIVICLLHPLKDQLNVKTDRGVVLTDCFGQHPVLIISWDKNYSLESLCFELALTSTSENGRYFSSSRLCIDSRTSERPIGTTVETHNDRPRFSPRPDENGKEDLDIIRMTLPKSPNSPQRIDLGGLRIGKRPDHTLKQKEFFVLRSFQTEEPITTNESRPGEANKKFSLKQMQLTVRPSDDATNIFYSNIINIGAQNKQLNCCLDISVIPPSSGTVAFNLNNKYRFELAVKIPQPFHCTLGSGCKWLKISILTNHQPSPVYYFDMKNGEKKTVYYFKVKTKAFKIPIQIGKRTANELQDDARVYQAYRESQSNRNNIIEQEFREDTPSILSSLMHNQFQLQVRILHSEADPTRLPRTYDGFCSRWTSAMFTDSLSNPSDSQALPVPERQSAADSVVYKRPSSVLDEPVNYATGLPICDKRQRTSTSDNNNSIDQYPSDKS